jgi:hypothetical protein
MQYQTSCCNIFMHVCNMACTFLYGLKKSWCNVATFQIHSWRKKCIKQFPIWLKQNVKKVHVSSFSIRKCNTSKHTWPTHTTSHKHIYGNNIPNTYMGSTRPSLAHSQQSRRLSGAPGKCYIVIQIRRLMIEWSEARRR